MRRIVLAIILSFLLSEIGISQDESLIFEQKLSRHFQDYYQAVTEDGAQRPQQMLLSDIKNLLIQYGFSKEQLIENDLEDLENKINQILNKDNKKIVLFANPESEIINCWLGEATEGMPEKLTIWGKEIEFIVKVMYNLSIRDFSYFLSQGKEAIEVGTRGNIIYYNLDAYKIRANRIWDFFVEREIENKSKRYESLKSNRLRKWLYFKAWPNLYVQCIKDNRNLDMAKAEFVNQAINLLKDNSLLHEAGHIFAKKYLNLNDEVKEEEIAFLTELRYGPLPYDSLETVISASYQSQMGYYNQAGREIISGFISYISDAQEKQNLEYRKIEIQGRNQTEKMHNLFKLTENQIRSISEYIYNQRVVRH